MNIKSVSEITNEIKLLLENKIGFVSVVGEISNYKPHYSGHKYFTLKDEYAQINCTLWKSRDCKFNLKDGLKVIVICSIDVHPPRGNYQIDVFSLMPAGIGDLYQEFELLKQKLDAKGYFLEERKKEIPEFIMNIGVSTSPTGAAIQDITSTIERRFPLVNIFFRPTIVQGDSAAEDIAKAITELSKYPVDVIIIGRGGGSFEDLQCYNTEEVADAIFNCPIPIISAIGHEIDFTIADFVADVRAATPTAAAELTTPIQLFEIIEQIDGLVDDMNRNMYQIVSNAKEMLKYVEIEKYYSAFFNRINYNYEIIDLMVDTMTKEIKFNVERNITEFNHLETNLIALSPITPLNRGYCLLQKDDRTIPNNISLSDVKTFEIIRKNEKIFANFEKII